MKNSLINCGKIWNVLSRRDFIKLSGSMFITGLFNLYLHPVLANIDLTPEFWRGRSDLPFIAITYDDCYLIKKLQELERLLEEYPDLKVTFFPIGEALLNTDIKDPGIWKRLYQKGHEIGYHTFNHVNPGVRSNTGMVEDYDKWYEACIKVVGDEPDVHFARPPGGSLSASFLYMCNERDLVAAMWSVSWGSSLEEAKKTMGNIHNGDIILMHISTVHLDISYVAFPYIKNIGLRAVTMTDLYAATLEKGMGSSSCTYPINHYQFQTCSE